MHKIYMVWSGNVGDTLNVMPLLSGLYKSTDKKIELVVNNKMKMFVGFREFMEYQECISNLYFADEVNISEYYHLSLVNNFTSHLNRPWETVRLEEWYTNSLRTTVKVDDEFVLSVPLIDMELDKFIVGDRMFHNNMDHRRSFNLIEKSGKCPLTTCEYLDYSKPMLVNAAILKATPRPIISTFTGISVIADLLNKPTIVLWNDELANWDNKPIEYSFNKHFYRNRRTQLMHINEFDLNNI